MNNKLLTGVLVLGIAATGFAGVSSANESNSGTTTETRTEMKALFEKAQSGVTLSETEQATLDEAKANRGDGKRGGKMGKRMGMSQLTDEEKTALEAMSDDEKKVFLTAKKEEKNAQKEIKQAIISKVLTGMEISAEEKQTLEIMTAENKEEAGKEGKGSEAKAIIAKLMAGETLTTEEETALNEINAKREERAAQKAIIEPLIEKKKAGEELTADEQATLDELKANNKGKGGKNKGGEKGERGSKEMEVQVN